MIKHLFQINNIKHINNIYNMVKIFSILLILLLFETAIAGSLIEDVFGDYEKNENTTEAFS